MRGGKGGAMVGFDLEVRYYTNIRLLACASLSIASSHCSMVLNKVSTNFVVQHESAYQKDEMYVIDLV